MINPIYYTPGQVATLILNTVGADGYRANCDDPPVINSLILPDLSNESNYPQAFTNLAPGLYVFQYQIPSGGIAVGSYLFEILYNSPTGQVVNDTLQLIVNAPYGVYNILAP